MIVKILLALTILMTLWNMLRLRRLSRQIAETKDSIHNTVTWAKDDLRNDMTGIRTVVKLLARGATVTEDMIDEGKPFADISAADADRMLKEESGAVVVDVRTQSEYIAGHVPGAKLIPVDEIEYRANEVPRDAKTVLVICQGGGRSAAACEVLSKMGYTNLANVYDGMGAWPGKREIGVSIKPPASAQTAKQS